MCSIEINIVTKTFRSFLYGYTLIDFWIRWWIFKRRQLVTYCHFINYTFFNQLSVSSFERKSSKCQIIRKLLSLNSLRENGHHNLTIVISLVFDLILIIWQRKLRSVLSFNNSRFVLGRVIFLKLYTFKNISFLIFCIFLRWLLI